MNDLLRPTTDAGVLVQVAVLAMLVVAGLVATRRRRDVRLLVVGTGLLVLGLIGLRAVH